VDTPVGLTPHSGGLPPQKDQVSTAFKMIYAGIIEQEKMCGRDQRAEKHRNDFSDSTALRSGTHT
jgi:hypothetical protein